MGMYSDIYIGYHVKVDAKSRVEETTYLRRHCSNNSCVNFDGSISSNFCPSCGGTAMESVTPQVKTVRGTLPDEFVDRNNDTFQVFRHDDGNSIFLLPNRFSEQEKFGPITDEFRNGGITSVIVHGYFAEEFDEFREYYASLLKILDDADLKYNVEYGVVKYYH